MNLRHKLADLYEQQPDMWTQGAYARDANGELVEWFSENATCFCIEGGLWRLNEPLLNAVREGRDLFDDLNCEVRIQDVAFNDAPGRTVQEVIAYLRSS